MFDGQDAARRARHAVALMLGRRKFVAAFLGAGASAGVAACNKNAGGGGGTEASPARSPAEYGAAGSGADDGVSLSEWINSGQPLYLPEGKWKSSRNIIVKDKALDVTIAPNALLDFSGQHDADSLVFENCSGVVRNLTIRDVAIKAGVWGTLVVRRCKDLFFYNLRVVNGKALRVIFVDCDNCHIFGGGSRADDDSNRGDWSLCGCSNSTINNVSLQNTNMGITLLGPGYKSGTRSDFMTTRPYEETLGMGAFHCTVDNHRKHAFNISGCVGAAINGCIARHHTGKGNAAFQVKQTTNIRAEHKDDAWANRITNCIAYDQVLGFGTQQGADAIFENNTADRCKRNGMIINSSARIVVRNFTVRDWGLDLREWPLLNGDKTCAAIAVFAGSDNAVIDGLHTQITDMRNQNVGALSLVTVSGKYCTIDGTSLDKRVSGTLAAGLVLKGTYCRVGPMVRGLTTVLYTNGTSIWDESPNTIYPIRMTKSVPLTDGTTNFDDFLVTSMALGKVVVRNNGSQPDGAPRYTVGTSEDRSAIVAPRSPPRPAAVDYPPLRTRAVTEFYNLSVTVHGGATRGNIVVQIGGVPNV